MIPPSSHEPPLAPVSAPLPLHLTVEPDGTLRIGTCEHCVLEPARPEGSWEPDGDRELDFDRDHFLALLATFGVETTISDQYVCP